MGRSLASVSDENKGHGTTPLGIGKRSRVVQEASQTNKLGAFLSAGSGPRMGGHPRAAQ